MMNEKSKMKFKGRHSCFLLFTVEFGLMITDRNDEVIATQQAMP
jgi:hypothetical protein